LRECFFIYEAPLVINNDKKLQELKKQILDDLVNAKVLPNRTYKNENSYYFRYCDDETAPVELSADDQWLIKLNRTPKTER